MPGGIPSHDTFGEVFSRLDPQQFQSCFMDWTREVAQLVQGEAVAIDGKTVRRSHDRSQGRRAIHLVSAWALGQVTLGQVKTEEKSNEITAIPRLLELLALRGCIVTIDAMGCQREIAEQIVDTGADYVLAVKENQGQLNDDLRDLFHGAQGYCFEGSPMTTPNLEQGPRTHRNPGVVGHYRPGLFGLPGDQEAMGWTAGGGESQRPPGDGGRSYRPVPLLNQQPEGPGGKDTGSGAPTSDHREFTALESGHWSLDVTFGEDQCRVRKDHAPQNLATLRQISHNLLKKETSPKIGIQGKRLNAGWRQDYLLKVLLG